MHYGASLAYVVSHNGHIASVTKEQQAIFGMFDHVQSNPEYVAALVLVHSGTACLIGAKRRPAQVRSVLPILMCAQHKSHSLGALFADNKPDSARRATSNDDAVLIPGEPEARHIGGRDRIAEDFVISQHDWSPVNLPEPHNETITEMAVHRQREPDECGGAGHRCNERP